MTESELELVPMTEYPITIAEFRAWLETKRPTEIVGGRRNGFACPIARYLVARGDGTVYVDTIEIASFSGVCLTPAWVAGFARQVDDGREFLIRARTALRLLDRVAHATLPAEDDAERLALEMEVVL